MRTYSKQLALAAAALFAIFLGIQFIRPELPRPPVTGDIDVPQPVKQVLRKSCYDCHSNQTKLAWFDQIVPAYWLVLDDVKRARGHLNFSEIGRLPPAQQRGALFEAVNQMQFGAMPLKSYAIAHPESRITPAEVAVLKQYLIEFDPIPVAKEQDDTWPSRPVTAVNVRPALNGIAFVPGYKDWKVISSTDRFDNHTIRVVLGNDVAVRAVESNHVNPWPDGTMFAKVAWEPTRKFVQVEFMIKDKSKYASTKGWGFARWKGNELAPYGKNAAFAEECVGCHTPMRDNDFVFTTPVPRAADGLPNNPFEYQVINASADSKDGTMSMLYGNYVAVRSARGSSHPNYPSGSVLSLVTWAQRDDDHWFGARVPGRVKSVEFVTVGPGPASYQEFTGLPFKRTAPNDGDSRTNDILRQRALLMP